MPESPASSRDAAQRDGALTSLPRNQSLVRGAQLVRALSSRPDGGSIAELSRAVELPRTTVVRLLATLAEVGFVERIGSRWIVGSEIVRLGRAADPFRSLTFKARPMLEELSDTVGESTLLQTLTQNWNSEALLQVDPPSLVGAINWVGRRFAGELHASSMGKLGLAGLRDDEIEARLPVALARYTDSTITDLPKLLVELQRVRQQGYAVTIDELEEGLTAVSAPIDSPAAVDAMGIRALSVGISGPSSRLSASRRREVLPPLLRCRDRVAALIAESFPI